MKVIVLILLVLIQSGCMTILRGSEQEIQILTEPTDAKIEMQGRLLSPGTIEVPRKGNSRVFIEKEGYERKSILLSSSLSRWIWLELLISPLFSLVDVVTGAAFNVTPEITEIKLEKIIRVS